MQIQATPSYNPVRYQKTALLNIKNSTETNKIIPTLSTNFPFKTNINNKYFISFGAITPEQAVNADSALYNKYLKKGQPDIIEFLDTNVTTPTVAFKFLCHATSDERTSEKTAKDLSANPRKAGEIKDKLIKILGGDKKGEELFMTWFHDEEHGYRKAYSQYYNNQIWNQASSLNELVKQSPNIAPWAIERKAKELGREVILGEVPAEFKDIETYRNLIEEIKKSDFHKAYLKAKDAEMEAECGDTMETATKANIEMERHNKPFEIIAGGERYTVNPVMKSLSAKNIYFITPQNVENPKSYVLKFDPYSTNGNTDMARKLTESSALRPDMPYLDAMVDFYLKENNSPNAPDIKLYDYKTKSVLYEATQGEEPIIPEKHRHNLYSFLRLDKIKDLMNLGIILSDVHSGNFKVNKEGECILIDSGHSVFSNTFRPPVIGKHIVLGNLCGRELCT